MSQKVLAKHLIRLVEPLIISDIERMESIPGSWYAKTMRQWIAQVAQEDQFYSFIVHIDDVDRSSVRFDCTLNFVKSSITGSIRANVFFDESGDVINYIQTHGRKRKKVVLQGKGLEEFNRLFREKVMIIFDASLI